MNSFAGLVKDFGTYMIILKDFKEPVYFVQYECERCGKKFYI